MGLPGEDLPAQSVSARQQIEYAFFEDQPVRPAGPEGRQHRESRRQRVERLRVGDMELHTTDPLPGMGVLYVGAPPGKTVMVFAGLMVTSVTPLIQRP